MSARERLSGHFSSWPDAVLSVVLALIGVALILIALFVPDHAILKAAILAYVGLP